MKTLNREQLDKNSFRYLLKCPCTNDHCEYFHNHGDDLLAGSDQQDPNRFLTKQEWQSHCLQSLREDLNRCKSKISEFQLIRWEKHTKYTDISSGIIPEIRTRLKETPPILTRAWIKFYEILSNFDLIDCTRTKTNAVRALFLCEAPGGFINAANHFIKSRSYHLSLQWIANTLNPYYEEMDRTKFVADDWFIKDPFNFSNWFFGKSNTGDLLEANFSNSLSKFLSQKFMIQNDDYFDLVTADGAFGCLDCFDKQEEAIFPLIATEIKIALRFLQDKGKMVVKFFTFFHCKTVSILYALSICFGYISCFKPLSSKHGNSEVYVVCKNFDRVKYAQIAQIFDQIAENGLQIKAEMIPQQFMKNICDLSEKLSQRQMKIINYNVESFQGILGKDRKLLELRKKSVAQSFIKEYSIFSLFPNLNLFNPSPFDVAIFCRRLYDFENKLEKSEIQNQNLKLEKLSRLIKKFNKNQVITMKTNKRLKRKFSKEIKMVHGKPYNEINNSKFVCHSVLRAYNLLKSLNLPHRQSTSFNLKDCFLKIFRESYQPVADFLVPFNIEETFHFLDLFNHSSSYHSNDYEVCTRLKVNVQHLVKDGKIIANHSLVIRVKSLISRLSVSLMFLLSNAFEQYLICSTESGLICCFFQYQPSPLDDSFQQVFGQQSDQSVWWNETLLDLMPLPYIQDEDFEFFQQIHQANNFNLMHHMKAIVAEKFPDDNENSDDDDDDQNRSSM